MNRSITTGIIVLWAIFMVACGGFSADRSTTAPTTEGATTTTISPLLESVTIRDGKFEFSNFTVQFMETIDERGRMEGELWPSYIGDAKGIWMVLSFDIENIGDEPRDWDGSVDFSWDGAEYDCDWYRPRGETINPKLSLAGAAVLCDVPSSLSQREQIISIEVADSFMSLGTDRRVRINTDNEVTRAAPAGTAAVEPSTTNTGLRSVDLALSTVSGFGYGYWIALDQGFYEDEGLNVTLQGTGGSSDVAFILAANNAEAGMGVSAAALFAIEDGVGLYPFFTYAYGEVFDVVVPAGSSISDIAGLAGKVIGISELAGGEVPLVRALLVEARLDPDTDVNIIEVGTDAPSVKAAIDRGDIQAYSSAKSDIAMMNEVGLDTMSIAPASLDTLPAEGLLATNETKNDRDLLIGLGRATAKGQLMAYTNFDGAVCILKRYIPDEFTNEQAGRRGLAAVIEITTPPQQNGDYRFGFLNADGWNTYVNIFVQAGVLSAPFDMSEYVIDDLLDEINDFDRQEIIDLANNLPTECTMNTATTVDSPLPTRVTTTTISTNLISSGIYEVGYDINPGLYRFYTPGLCYWERLAGFSGEFGDIITNNNVTGYFIVEVLPRDAGFGLNCTGAVQLVDSYADTPGGQRLSPDTTVIPSGVYEVGIDIEPGLYRLEGSCYWERLAGFSGEFEDIIANNNTNGVFRVEIQASDAGFGLACV